MTEILFLALGILIGWGIATLLERRHPTIPADDETRPATRRPNRRQQKILASLPPNPPRPTIDELVAAEIEHTGVDRIAGNDGLPVPTMLKVWHRDRPGLACADEDLRFVVEPGVDRTAADVEHVRLEGSEKFRETMEPE